MREIKNRKKILMLSIMIMLVHLVLDSNVVYAYNRNNAVSYANQYALKRNKKYVSFESDCTNFVSQCLEAGGYKQNNSWFVGLVSSSKKWAVAEENYNYLKKKGWGKLYKKYSNNDKYPNPGTFVSIDKGDIVYYDWTGNGTIDHASIVTFSGQSTSTGKYSTLISQHTTDRKNVLWNLQSYLKSFDKQHNTHRAEKCVYYVVNVN